MKVKVSKKTILVVVVILIVALLGVGSYFGIEFIKTNNKIKETEQKLSNINVEKLKTKLIEELEKSRLKTKMEEIKVDTMVVLANFGESEYFNGYVSETVLGMYENNVVGAFEIPIFKINTNSNGKFKNIEYADNLIIEGGIMRTIIEKVFEREYNIKLYDSGIFRDNYSKRFFKYDGGKKELYGSNINFYTLVMNKISGRNTKAEITDNMKTVDIRIWGL